VLAITHKTHSSGVGGTARRRYTPPIVSIAGQRPPNPFPGRTAGETLGDLNVTEQEIEAKVIEIVAEQMGVDKAEISRDTSFVNDLNADSLDTVELVMEFEDEFETSIPDEEAEKIQTVGQAISFILKAQSQKAAS